MVKKQEFGFWYPNRYNNTHVPALSALLTKAAGVKETSVNLSKTFEEEALALLKENYGVIVHYVLYDVYVEFPAAEAYARFLLENQSE